MPHVIPKIAVVTGASSGVGAAIAIKLAQRGWNVVAIARRPDALQQTIKLAGPAASRLTPIECDVSDPAAVEKMAAAVLEKFNTVHALVNSAGTNTPDRSFANLSLKTWRQVIEINQTGTYLCIQAFLPAMRKQQSGTIINIVSDSAIQPSMKAGAAYVASKFAIRGLTMSLNAEERSNGIRACAIYPGDIDTPLLERRPTPPTADARKKMLTPDDVAECALLAITLPDRAVIEELLIRPR
ncbi:MAG TPA: SDR family oxidoreductase [Tepidisphaeraceae bacterium]|jgi:NADP-dependent 3-hydroxy acid dehydrogenase YdfG|nr:SDR family oxidoreductase [Tepidisphaeraceae bacterium]